MASPTLHNSAQDENASPSKDVKHTLGSSIPSTRPVLGNMSPNVRIGSPPAAFLRKPLSGSPLKRSFTAAMEGGEGFKYLKRRRLGDGEVLSDVADASVVPLSGLGQAGLPTEAHVPEVPHPSPTEPNTPSEGSAEEDTQGSSAERKSFSSLINYDPSSQPSTLLFKTVSNAELLRLRLRVALYKVRTNQVDVPFTELQVEGQCKKAPSRSEVEAAVAALRKEAYEVAARETRPSAPRLLPASILRPSAYSSRMIYDSNLPSSPPVSASPDKWPDVLAVSTTPPREQRNTSCPTTNVQKLTRTSEPELTSSAIKGRVVEGLLGLRNAA